jgi:eukaryotic-like serine/threonine-protein kinase
MPLYEAFTDKYEILEKIGQGGMGAVYRVRHRLLDELRVIKVIRSPLEPTAELTERFLHEARTASRLRHPNLALLHDFSMSENGEKGEAGVAYLVLEHIDGFTLKEVLRRFGPAPVEVALEIGRQACRALEYLHRQRIVHRDISPANLMLTRDSEGRPLVKLIDLGLAKSLEAGSEGVTTGGVFLGKLRYASPEQFGAELIDERADLYSLGVVLYELLTGRSPFKGHDPQSWMASHLFGMPMDFAVSDPEGRVPEDLRALLLRTLSRKPEKRVASAAEFAAALEVIQARYPLVGDEMTLLFEPEPEPEPEPQKPEEKAAVAELSEEPSKADPLIVPISIPAAGLEADWDEQGRSTEKAEEADAELTDSLYLVPPPRGSAVDEASPWDAIDAETGGAPERPLSRKMSFLPAALPVGVMLVLALFMFLKGRPWWNPQIAEPPNVPPAAMPAPVAAVPTPTPSPVLSPAPEPVIEEGIGSRPDIEAPVTEKTAAEEAVAERPATKPAPRREKPVRIAEQRSEPRAKTKLEPKQEPRPKPEPALEPERPQPARTRIPEIQPAPARRAAPVTRIAPRIAQGPMHRGDLIQSGRGVSVPVPLSMPRYSYPAAARGAGDVDVRCELLVDEKGRVVDAVVREGDPSHVDFNAVALAAARKVTFQPGTRNNIPGKMWTEMIFSFSEPTQAGR